MRNQCSITYLVVIFAVLTSQSAGQKVLKRLEAHNTKDFAITKRFSCNDNKKRMFTSDMSYTVSYKLGQIPESTFHNHWNQVKRLHGSRISEKVHWHSVLFSGYQLPGDVTQETLDFVRSLPGVSSVSRSKLFRSHAATPWGLDRIDQKKLPLDGIYKPKYNGSGVNVFIVDSGLDTSHTEFMSTTPKREVRNIFDSYSLDGSSNISPDNDGVGHGTHVAGTVGGNTVGVSPGANLYSVRVLNSDGAGSDFDILSGLSFIYDWYMESGRQPSIVSMSLGGECISYLDCEQDILVLAVEALSEAGIIVVTAAGNSDCDSCLQTPAFSPHAITVGASSSKDEAAVFSDFGKCIDIYAPGVNISSACGQAMCNHATSKLISLSGTSMATPHVSGVIAQMLQANPTATVKEISTLLSCNASPLVLDIKQDRSPAATRNLLLQIPTVAAKVLPRSDRIDGDVERLAVCDLGAGCGQFNNCSGRGLCEEGRCLCDTLAWGSNCSSSEFGAHCDMGYEFVPYSLLNGGGDSWHGAELKISQLDNEGVFEPVLTSSMCAGYESTSGACLRNGEEYRFEVSFPEDHFNPSSALRSVDVVSRAAGQIGWSICGEVGGVPANMAFRVSSSQQAAQRKSKCEMVCHTSVLEIGLTSKAIVDPTGELPPGLTVGWGGGYYSLLHESTGVMYAGGTLLALQNPVTHRICLPDSIFSSSTSVINKNTRVSGQIVAIFSDGSSWDGNTGDPSRAWSVCGVTQTLATDFSFFESVIQPFTSCQQLAPPILHDKRSTIVNATNEILSPAPTRVGVFSAHSHPSGSLFNTSGWYEREYVISSRGTVDRMAETPVSNGSISSSVSAAQFGHPLSGLEEWILRVKAKSGIASPTQSTSAAPVLHPSLAPSLSETPSLAPVLISSSPLMEPTTAQPFNLLTAAPSMLPSMFDLNPSEIPSARYLLDETSMVSIVLNSDLPSLSSTSKISDRQGTALSYQPATLSMSQTGGDEPEETQERPFWMSCGVKGKMDEYYKFHRTDTALGCERSCLMLNATRTESRSKGNAKDRMLIDFDKDSALSFFTKADNFSELQALRSLTKRNFVCMGNKTSAADTQCFRIIVGGGTNLKEPIWQFCNLQAVPAAAVVEFCVTDWTECTAKIVHQPTCPTQSSPPALLPPGDATSSAPPGQDIIPISGPTTGMYMLLYDDKGSGWSGAEYVITFFPTSLRNFALSVILPGASGQATPRRGRDNTDDLGGSDDVGPAVSPMGEVVVKIGSLEAGKQTGYASVCLVDGCYTADVSLGERPEQIAWVLCSMIGAAGMEGVFEISNGRCMIHSSMMMCQLTRLIPFFTLIYWSIYGAGATIFLVIATLIGLFCRRVKVRGVGKGRVSELSPSLMQDSRSPLHAGNTSNVNSSTNDGMQGGGRADLENGVELSVRTDIGQGHKPVAAVAARRVFNGDYSQVPIENDEE